MSRTCSWGFRGVERLLEEDLLGVEHHHHKRDQDTDDALVLSKGSAGGAATLYMEARVGVRRAVGRYVQTTDPGA